MSDYVTREEMEDFVANELAKAAAGLSQAIETRGSITQLALENAVTAETMAFVSLCCHPDRDRVISQLESMMEAQEVRFLYSQLTDEQIAAHRQRLSGWLEALRKAPR